MTNIDEARKRLKRLIEDSFGGALEPHEIADVQAVLDALDAAIAEMHARELHHFEEEQRSAGLAAVIEQAKGLFHGDGFRDSTLGRLLHSVAADVLRERDAEKWDECVIEAFSLGWVHEFGRDDLEARNPYRETMVQR